MDGVVIGAGTMGLGIAYVLAAAGDAVTVVEPDDRRARAARTRIAEVAQGAVRRGRLGPEDAGALVGRIVFRSSLDQVEATNPALVVEAVPERLELKRTVLRAAEALEPRMLATNTSGLSIDAIAEGLTDPASFIGLHFFNPVWAMPLVEIVRGSATDEPTLRSARELVARIGKESIVVKDTPGFATSRLGVALGLEAMRMLEEGVGEAADIDRAMELGYRHPMGPLRLTDLVGLDVRLDIARHLAETYGPRFAPPRILEEKVARGELGKKSGRGFYDWSE
ncbi:3-hydroxyacyl-CoA dehydrogenase family protein [Thermomonospora cellulosilytica]|uniref:3-hydroxybutyryl-CoA dehydrogenase n=1 Tax=Thermomonospora cellulosilytica TaxID=1411118 RepID=A0A7W3R7T5_9ACTN|nr:3-hydroxyacyl-CoA dehydrogenase family protein [Thermomonospora cellulosilytica]MBA9002685.1 3-hydroxybutyryl-CoA dehydrogenase [Thermomonospora cellulosilytica]